MSERRETERARGEDMNIYFTPHTKTRTRLHNRRRRLRNIRYVLRPFGLWCIKQQTYYSSLSARAHSVVLRAGSIAAAAASEKRVKQESEQNGILGGAIVYNW